MEIANKFNTLAKSRADTTNALMRYGPALLTLLLVLATGSKLADLTWLMLDKKEYSATPAAAAARRAPAESADVSSQIGNIVRAHLFGEASEELVADTTPATDKEPVIETSANLTLKGTVASTTDSNGLAIIDNGSEENVFTVGDEVRSGIELHRVYADRVHLNERGVITQLQLPKLTESQPSRGSSTANTRPNRSQTRPTRNPIQQIANAAPAKLGDLLRPQPVFQNGKQLGYRVYPGRKRDQFKALGLKAGDLVTEINGTPLNDPSRGLEIFRSLNESSQVAVTLQRNGTQTSLVLDTSTLNLAEEK